MEKYYKYINGKYVEMTEEEIAWINADAEANYNQRKNADMSDEEKIQLLVSTLTEDKTNKLDNGEVKTAPVIRDGVIVWLPTEERAGSGTLTDPKQYVEGDSVTTGVYYCQYKIGASGRPYAQLTSGTYKAITDGAPSKFGAITHFEAIH